MKFIQLHILCNGATHCAHTYYEHKLSAQRTPQYYNHYMYLSDNSPEASPLGPLVDSMACCAVERREWEWESEGEEGGAEGRGEGKGQSSKAVSERMHTHTVYINTKKQNSNPHTEYLCKYKCALGMCTHKKQYGCSRSTHTRAHTHARTHTHTHTCTHAHTQTHTRELVGH